MSWDDFYRRRDAIDAVVRRARREPQGPLPFAEVPDAAAVFSGPSELLLALHYRWSLKLTGRLGLALAEADRDSSIDRVDAVTRAWHETAAEFPDLRTLLDTHADACDGALRPAVASEQRMLAIAAGIAEPGEPQVEVTRIGHALLALIRTAPDRTPEKSAVPQQAWRRHPVAFLRKLVASV